MTGLEIAITAGGGVSNVLHQATQPPLKALVYPY